MKTVSPKGVHYKDDIDLCFNPVPFLTLNKTTSSLVVMFALVWKAQHPFVWNGPHDFRDDFQSLGESKLPGKNKTILEYIGVY